MLAWQAVARACSRDVFKPLLDIQQRLESLSDSLNLGLKSKVCYERERWGWTGART